MSVFKNTTLITNKELSLSMREGVVSQSVCALWFFTLRRVKNTERNVFLGKTESCRMSILVLHTIKTFALKVSTVVPGIVF
jgi:hypothetical protein